jgi:asparagine synthase (glutamine-hydrolysing)
MTPTTAPTPLLPPAAPASAHAPLPGTETAVDAFAVRTLCCRVRGDRLQLASRADALAEGCDLDPQALFDYLFFHAIPSPRTVFQGVQRVPPAHRAELVDGQVRMTRTWTPEFEPDPSPDFDRLRGEFRAALQAAVASRLDGGKAACFLSGGTDSSTVAGMIGLASGKPAATYSIGFEAEGYDEMAYARMAARHFGTEHHEYYVTPEDLVRHIPAVAAHHDQPFGNSSALPAYCCALRPEGGRRHPAAGRRRWRRAVRRQLALRQAAHLRLVTACARAVAPRPAGAILRPAGRRADSAAEEGQQLHRTGPRAHARPAADVQPAAPPGHAGGAGARLPGSHRHRGAGAPAARGVAQARARHEIDRMLAFDWRYTLAESDLPKVRGAAELAGIEVAFPMLDDALLAMALRLPPGYKLKG